MKKLITAASLSILSLAIVSTAGEDTAEPAQSGFTGVFSDSAADVDNDGRYEYLVISAEVHITSPGRYYLEGGLAYDLDYLISHRPNWLSTAPLNVTTLDCDTGLVTFYLPFSGEDIYRTGIDGSYEASLSLYRDAPGAGTGEKTLIGKESLGYKRYNTAEYNHLNFREYDAEITGFGILDLELEKAVDTSGNGLFDMLEATISIGDMESTMFNLRANLMGSSGRIATFGRLVTTRPGPIPASLSFPGAWIHRSGQDGPYTIDVTLTETRGKRFARKRFTTEGSYRYLDFQPAPEVNNGGAVKIISN